MDSKKTGAFICALRKEKGLTQAALSEMLNVSNRTVSKWENGDGFPDITILPQIAAVFGITVDELLCGERKPQAPAVKVEEVENKENLINLFQISFVISFFIGAFAALLGVATELYSIWAFRILFYTHWEIIFAAVSLAGEIAAGLVFAVGVTRLGVSYDKKSIVKIAGKKTLLLAAVLLLFPIAFMARIVNVVSGFAFWGYLSALILIVILMIVLKVLYDKIK
ncbi:MAG: helix-turn-helix domain-containing protein [Clostridiales bacterium]|nr:helix-turn-helix domain-containing protein [Clostridiales bacterium]